MLQNPVVEARPAVEGRAYEILVRLNHRRVLAYALALTHRQEVAEDLVQEAFLVAHRDLAKFDPTRDFGAWVRGIVRMKYLEWARAHRMERLEGRLLDAIEERHRAWDRAVEHGREDAVSAVRTCLQLLSTHLGSTVEMFYTDGQSCARIAEMLGTTEVVIRKRLQRAREALSDCLRRRDVEG